VLAVFAPGGPQLELWPVYLGALAAQVVLGTAAASAREYFVGRLSIRDELSSAMAAYQLDVLVSPLGLVIAVAAAEVGPVALGALVPAAIGLSALSRLHRMRCDRLVAEHEAYWGRFLRDSRRLERCALSDVSEDWRCMPELALAVGTELGLPMDARLNLAQAAQAAARSVAVPGGGAGRSSPQGAERRLRLAAVLIEGRIQKAGSDPLVSGLAFDRLREQADLVRSIHERFDGRGSPSRLRGEAIPLGARILACCQAYSSMTSGGHDRAPMSAEIAVEELRRGAGSRFDPTVVSALCRALRHEDLGAVPAPVRSPWLLEPLRTTGAASLSGRPSIG
jgi:hypothetical protein